MNEDTQIEQPPVQSDQQAPHPDLEALVTKHCQTRWRKPIPEHTQKSFDYAMDWLAERGKPPLVLDSFCGTGMSTKRLAEQHGDAAVIGLDKSTHRLTKHADASDQYLLLRAECEPFWQLLKSSNMKVAHHYLLYPNPWPKSSQLKRRVHGHPGFPLLAHLGGAVEMRSNWQVYAQEFALACALIGFKGTLEQLKVTTPWTLFEKKYSERNHTLWCVRGIFSD